MSKDIENVPIQSHMSGEIKNSFCRFVEIVDNAFSINGYDAIINGVKYRLQIKGFWIFHHVGLLSFL
jgi:hypothetical protein